MNYTNFYKENKKLIIGCSIILAFFILIILPMIIESKKCETVKHPGGGYYNREVYYNIWTGCRNLNGTKIK